MRLTFTGKAVPIYGLISRLTVLLVKNKCNVAMFSCFKKSEKIYFLLREAYLLA